MDSTAIIHFVSVTLGLSTPVILFFILRSGITNSSLPGIKKKKYTGILVIFITSWSLLMWGLILQGFFSYTDGDVFPAFLLALLFPIVVIITLLRPSDFVSIIDHITLQALIAGQSWRVLGTVFFIIALSGLGPKAYIWSGIGDLTTGMLAIITFFLIVKKSNLSNLFAWLLTFVGLTDLMIVLYIMIGHYPIWSDTIPSTEAAGTYPMMLIVGLAAPVALLLHVFTIMKMLKSNSVEARRIVRDKEKVLIKN